MKNWTLRLNLKPILIIGLALWSFSCSPKGLSFDEMRLRYRETLLGSADLDPSDSVVKSRISALNKAVGSNWSSLNKSPERTYLWADCNVEGKSPITLAPYGRLLNMAIGYGTRGSQYYGNDSLKRDIIEGMEWMNRNRYNPSIPLYDNWWAFVIGTPLSLNRLMVILYDDLTEEQRSRYEAAMNFYAPNVTYEGASTGANKVWQCNCMALRGILGHNSAQLDMAVAGLETEFKTVTSRDGFYEDGSFVQHQWHAYTGGYGRSLIDQLTTMAEIVHGSRWEVPKKDMSMLYGWIRNAYEPLLYRGAMMDMVRGREISRPGAGDRGVGHNILVQCFKLSLMAPPAEKAYLQGLVKQQALADTYRDLIIDIPLSQVPAYRAMMADPAVPPTPEETLYKSFAAMDRVAYKTPSFALGVSMSSARIENYETINEENLKGWYTSDGMTYLYDNDLKQYSDNFWATVNPYRMAGTTVDTRIREAKTLPLAPGLLYADGYKSPQHWVGGCSLGEKYGIAGMWLSAYESTLEAKKTWFTVGNEIMALGAGIHSTDNRDIETTVENRKLNLDAHYQITLGSGNKQLSEKGQLLNQTTPWVHFAGEDEQTAVGYFFPEPTAINALREMRTSSWHDINGIVLDSTPISREYFTLWINHGKNPANGTYQYILLPGRSAEQTALYAAAPTMEVIANTAQVQAVRHKGEHLTGINFWEAPSAPLAGVSVNAPASVMVQDTPTAWVISVSDPTQLNTGVITLELQGKASQVDTSSKQIKVRSTSPTIIIEVDVNGTLGRTHTITLKK